jgi:hypothetical protein
MSEAIENCAVFLMCLSEKYYQSPSSRLEAEHAHRLQKPILPLIMQSDYMPCGWLASIIGGRLFYKFAGTKLPFEHNFSSMLKEINRHININIHHQDADLNTNHVVSNNLNSNNTRNNHHHSRAHDTRANNNNNNGRHSSALPPPTQIQNTPSNHNIKDSANSSYMGNMYCNNTNAELVKNYLLNTSGGVGSQMDRNVKYEIIRKQSK